MSGEAPSAAPAEAAAPAKVAVNGGAETEAPKVAEAAVATSKAAANAGSESDGRKGGAGETAVEEEPEMWVSPEILVAMEPAACFERARKCVKQLHEALDIVEECKQQQQQQGADDQQETFSKAARAITSELLMLRVAHRGMFKAAEASRSMEANTRKSLDAAFSNLETHQFASSSRRSACGRITGLLGPDFHPQLKQLLPHLDYKYELNGEIESDGELPKHIESEHQERMRLEKELSKVQSQHVQKVEALKGCERSSKELTAKIAAVEKALEPVSVLLKLERPAKDHPPVVASSTTSTTGQVQSDAQAAGRGDGPPPEKRQKVA